MNFEGLSLDQAPSISAPLRFFLSAPLFGVVAGVIMLFGDPTLLVSRFSSETILLTHVLTIGFLALIMFGALIQMLPVLAGVSIPKATLVSKISHFLISLGLILMIVGMFLNLSKVTLLSSLLLGFGFLSVTIPMLYAARNIVHMTASARALVTGIVFATIITLMGMHLLASHGLGKFSSSHLLFANIHSVWAIFGFAGVLIIGVAFQVLPMFYVAPRFKRFCKQKVVWLITSGLLLWLVLNIFIPSFATVAKIWVALFFWAFSTTVFLKMRDRRRPIKDATVFYWYSASISMTLGTFAWVIDDFLGEQYIVLVSILIGGGFILSIMQGMLYKIVPFLVWFHLNAKGYMSIPTINEMIDKEITALQFGLFIVSLVGLVISVFVPSLIIIFASTFILSMVLLEYNIIQPVLVYMRTIKTKPEFDMSEFS